MLTHPFGGRIRVTFVDKEGDEHTYEVATGDNLLDIAQSEELEMEGTPPVTLYRPRNSAANEA